MRMLKWLKEHVRVDLMVHFNWWTFPLAIGVVPFDWEDGTTSYYVDLDVLCFRISLLLDLGEVYDDEDEEI